MTSTDYKAVECDLYMTVANEQPPTTTRLGRIFIRLRRRPYVRLVGAWWRGTGWWRVDFPDGDFTFKVHWWQALETARRWDHDDVDRRREP